jgi:CheY-like chemotaxis protein
MEDEPGTVQGGEAAKACSRCRAESRERGQRWGRRCLSDYQKARWSRQRPTVDDDPSVRQAFTGILRAMPDVALLGEAADGRFAVALARAMRPDIVLMDIEMPVMSGIDATRIIHANCPGVRVIGLALDQPAQRVQAMLDAGAIACVSSYAALDTLLTALVRRPPVSRHPKESQG